jgi:hypothetical protein
MVQLVFTVQSGSAVHAKAQIMGSIDWVSFAIGVVMVGLGILCFFSTKLQRWGMEYTSQGVVWGKIVGAKRAPYVVKYVSSIGFLVFAGFIFYDAFFGHR